MDSSPVCQARPRAAPAGNLWGKLDEISSNDVWTLRRQVIHPFFFNYLFLVIQSFFSILYFWWSNLFSNSFFLVIQPFFFNSLFLAFLQWWGCRSSWTPVGKAARKSLVIVRNWRIVLLAMWQGFLISWIWWQFFYFIWGGLCGKVSEYLGLKDNFLTSLELRCKTSELGLRKKLKVEMWSNQIIRRIR